MKGASQSFYFLPFSVILISLISFSSYGGMNTFYNIQKGEKHPKCSHFRYLKTPKALWIFQI